MLIGAGLLLSSPAKGAEAAETAPIVIRGKTYYPLSDEAMRTIGFDVPEVPLAENAAYVYFEAINAAWEPERGSELRDLRDNVLKYGWSEDAAALNDYLDRNTKALELAKQAASTPACFFPIMFSSKTAPDDMLLGGASMPYAKGMRELATLCVVQGKKLEFDGKPGGALESYLLVARLGNHAACGPFLIDGLVGIACNTIGLKAIESSILQNELDEETLADVQKQLHALSAQRPQLRRALTNEKICTEHTIEYTLRNPSLYMEIRNPAILAGGEELWRSELEKYDLSPDDWKDMMRADVAVFWEVADEYLRMPLPEFLKKKAGEKLSELVNIGKGERPPNMMSFLGLSLVSSRIMYARADLYWTIFDIELALARCKVKHGRYPDTLDALRVLMLGNRLDPFSEEPLRYRLEDDGSFTIWSIGENLTDDGGNVPEQHSPWQGDDYVWNSRLLGGDAEE